MKYSYLLFMCLSLRNVLQYWELLYFMSTLLCSFKRTEFTFTFETFATVKVNGHNYVIRGGYEIPKIHHLITRMRISLYQQG